MPEYTARIPEMQASLTEAFVAFPYDPLDPTPKPLGWVTATYNRLSAAITAYSDVRERALTASLLRLVPDKDATGESQQRLWSDELLRHGSEAYKRFNDSVTSDPDPFQLAFELMAMQESVTFTVFSRMPIAEAVGQIRGYMRKLEEEKRKFSDLWAEQSGQTERMDGQIAGVRNQVLEFFREAVATVRGWGPKTEENLRKSVEVWAAKEGADPEPSVGSSGAEAARNMSRTIDQLRLTNDQATRFAMPLYAGKTTIHLMFGNTRLQVKEFLDKVNKDTMRRLYDDAVQVSLTAAANVHQKEGVKRDAKRFVENAIIASHDILFKFNDEWDEFYEAFKGIYVEEPSDLTVNKLAEAEFFNRFWRDVEYLDLPGAFRIAGEAIARCENISNDKITPEQRRRLAEVIAARTKEMREVIRNMDMSMFERFKLFYFDIPLDQLRDKVKGLPGYRK